MRTRGPMPFTIGNDICHIPRILGLLKRAGPRFMGRILTREEIQQPRAARHLRCVLDERQRPPRDDGGDRSSPELSRAAQFMAGRFAAKEAVIKAHPHRRLTFQSIVITTSASAAAASTAARRGVGRRPAAAGKTTTMMAMATAEEGVEEVEEEEEQGEGEASPGRLPPTMDSSGPPAALIKGAEGAEQDVVVPVSISHDGDYATSVCIGYLGDDWAAAFERT
ncbi:hypothetical protein GGR56DRAFT_34687 [Xylariaceae sp. FL0804]|nr:hypothetical protein GGR56DRAFT_34687 [Xylariaceae sp. FL0804]